MKTKIVINPDYSSLEDFTINVPKTFMNDGHVIQNRRNIIKKYQIGDKQFNVKRFRKPIIINRIAYTFFRKSKAYRAYNNALILIKQGFDTPTPIAFIEEFENGLLSLSYFISTQIIGMDEIREYYSAPVSANKEFFTSFAQYTAKLHDAGILHHDYSPGNILVSNKEGIYNFCLIDINRMSFQKIGLKEGCKNFARLFGSDEIYTYLAAEYAKARKFEKKECVKYMLHYKNEFEKQKENKKKLKNLFKKA